VTVNVTPAKQSIGPPPRVAFPAHPPLWVPVTAIEYVNAAAGCEVGWMETVEVVPEVQLTGVGFDAGAPKMLDSNVTVPLAFSPKQ
jgi:hypothetical protein